VPHEADLPNPHDVLALSYSKSLQGPYWWTPLVHWLVDGKEKIFGV
jgi:hypothetical protein